jgi:ferrous iron transport protein A
MTFQILMEVRMVQQIKSLGIGESAEVVGYRTGSTAYRNRLLSMGLTKGTVLKLVKLAPLGDPVELEVRGFNLTLRKEEAAILEIRPVDSQGGAS